MSKPAYKTFARLRKRAYKRLDIQLHTEKDKDIIAFLEDKPSKQGFIKDLIRRELKAK